MITLTFEEIARVMGGTLHSIDLTSTTKARPIIDSRKAEVGTFLLPCRVSA